MKNENVVDFKPKNEKFLSPQFCYDFSLHHQLLQWNNFPINTFRFSQELIPSGTHDSSSTTASIGSISKECGRLWLDHNGLFGPRIYSPLLLCSHRRHLCLHLLLLQRWKEFKFLSRWVRIFENPHLVKCNLVMGQKTPPFFREGCNGPTDYYPWLGSGTFFTY